MFIYRSPVEICTSVQLNMDVKQKLKYLNTSFTHDSWGRKWYLMRAEVTNNKILKHKKKLIVSAEEKRNNCDHLD